MPMPVCVWCRLFFKPKKNGLTIEEGCPDGDEWAPYKLWHGDLWACRGCGAEIVIGFALHPLAEHYEPCYADMKARFAPAFRVDDC